jgi:hypothetical protein
MSEGGSMSVALQSTSSDPVEIEEVILRTEAVWPYSVEKSFALMHKKRADGR